MADQGDFLETEGNTERFHVFYKLVDRNSLQLNLPAGQTRAALIVEE